jgi:pimeloyl-ACP methyl ester carboxylesterase
MNATPMVLPAVLLLLSLLVFVLSVYRLRKLSPLRYGQGRRIAERTALYLAIVLAVAVGAGTTFNALAARHYREIYGAPGNLYSIDGYIMHIYCTGHGSPTIILDAGLGDDSLIWGKVQPELSKTTRVCSYDRAGFGWSEPRPGTQDANRIADQLHALLQQAGVTGPIVMMGHSIAGIYLRAYAGRYSQNVVGLIFVDASTPLQQDRSAAMNAMSSQKPKAHTYLARLFYTLGLSRLLGHCSHTVPGFADPMGKMLAEDECHPSSASVNQELASFRDSGNETIHTGPYGDLPILILSQDPEKAAGEQARVWNELQEDLKRLSTHSRRIIAKGSGHQIQIERADLINREVAVFIEQTRSGAPAAADNGLTKTE